MFTYTNAARQEIERRLEFDSTFVVSTIHSFSWHLIQNFHQDLKDWIRKNTLIEIEKLEEQEAKGRAGTKTSLTRQGRLASKKKRLDQLDQIKYFTYSPEGINSGRGSLNHSEVLKITSEFLSSKPLLQKILIAKYPILLIDESQDTKRDLIESLFLVQANHSNKFTLGLFGDTMQRIYMDGKPDLELGIPDSWMKPQKKVNYRCPKRVITLINKIRSDVDLNEQVPSPSNIEGIVRLFIIPMSDELNKNTIEQKVAEQMAEFSDDILWRNLQSEVKTLTLEHEMAAKRGGFNTFFGNLYSFDRIKTGLLDGSGTEIKFLIERLVPLVEAKQIEDDFRLTQILKEYSPLLERKFLEDSATSIKRIKEAKNAIEELFSLWDNKQSPILIDVLEKISDLRIFALPTRLQSVIENKNILSDLDDSEEEELNNEINIWENALSCNYTELVNYNEYVSDNSSFGTHQGVKGLEFPRVLVILDDEDSKGFLFSYEKLFGVKSKTATDIKNENEGKETGIDRTKRLFYVICSRAEESLAIVAYTESPDIVRDFVISEDWFSEEEIIMEI